MNPFTELLFGSFLWASKEMNSPNIAEIQG